jgi:hypothetical protein
VIRGALDPGVGRRLRFRDDVDVRRAEEVGLHPHQSILPRSVPPAAFRGARSCSRCIQLVRNRRQFPLRFDGFDRAQIAARASCASTSTAGNAVSHPDRSIGKTPTHCPVA